MTRLPALALSMRWPAGRFDPAGRAERIARASAKSVLASCLAIGLLLPPAVSANNDPSSGLLSAPGSAGLGFGLRSLRSPYVGADARHDLTPLYLYEGERFFLHASRVGLKLLDGKKHRVDVFLNHRYEGFPEDGVPASLTGMAPRSPGLDFGVSYRYQTGWGRLHAEYLHDAQNTSNGNELRFGYSYGWRSGSWALRPALTVSVRGAQLNNYYYGVRADEATAIRPAYAPGAGIDSWIGVYGSYDLSERWQLIGGLGATFFDRRVRSSPIVRNGAQPTLFIGAAYDFGAHRRLWADEHSRPSVKLLYGKAATTDCHLIRIMTLKCASTSAVDSTNIAGMQIGFPFIEKLNGWPLDFVGYVGLLHHDENGLQPNSLELHAYMKAYYYGFPWDARVRTRLGFGAGVSFAHRVPYVEARDQARRGRNSSRLLQYLDPSIDFSFGDLIGSRTLQETYLGLGVSHRSGIFGSSELLGNVNGGSNYVYMYVEHRI